MPGRAKSTRWPGSPPEVYGTRGAAGDAVVHNPGGRPQVPAVSARSRHAAGMRTRRGARAAVRLTLLVIMTVAALLAPPPPSWLSAAAVGPGRADGTVPAVARTWPVGTRPPVLRGWEPPATAYGRGHRGVDLAAAPGAPVRAVAAGRVSFAGRVAGRGVVSVELAGTGDPPLRTTYEPVGASV